MVKKAVKRGQIDLWKTASRWQRAWKVQKAFEADANTDRPKFFLTFPYPYVNGQPHIGHLYTFLRVESFARYKRMRGFNVLFPQAWHATGAPIDTAAGRVRGKDEVQIKALKAMGIPDEEIPKFVEPMHWIKTFSKAWERDLRGIGASIDWRRNFITTDLNPRYSKFISWQFRTLKKKGFVAKGKHPVVWCPKENVPVGDHARAEGEGEVPQEFLLFKHKLDDGRYLVSATLRPDTTLGITNLFVHPDFEYLEAEVNGEKWIFGEGCLEGLKGQDFKVKITGKVKGGSLIGKKVEEYGHVKVPILPATFLDPKMGTGLVHSVPSDSADDLIALRDLQKDEETCKKYGLDIEEVRRIKPIPILNTPGYGDIAADAMLKKYDVKSQNEREKLEKIKKELYKLSHYTATLNYRYKTAFSENLEGKKVEEAKEIIKNDLVKAGYAVPFYELSGRVVCRCQTECIVKIVSDQWFLKYSLPEWKQLAMKALQECKLYPEKIRPQFEYVIDWLRDWACTREYGMGTSLPWDKKWKIESLSDSTIYMAFYTITHLLKKVSLGKVNDKLFDYVFLGEGNPDELAVDKQVLDQLRHEFTYWYPVDFRNSGKDLVQNHLAFFLLNHVAVFPERFWPRGIGVNGYVSIQKMKMLLGPQFFRRARTCLMLTGTQTLQ
jgi:leucyl-tRNA synthetase